MTTMIFAHAEGGTDVAAGITIFSQGDAAGGLMYIVQQGEVDIVHNGTTIDTIGPGSFLGEVGLIENSPRTASAVAKTACRVLPVDEKRFVYLSQNTPMFSLQVMRSLAKRLRSSRGG